ncbi:MAG: DUF6494 family protein [Gemmatimonadota bacterium]
MDHELFDLEVRRFLQEFGVTAQREIESAVATAIAAGRLPGATAVHARARLEIQALGTYFDIERDIPLE